MKVKSNDRNKTLKIKFSGVVGVLEKLVDFFDIELFGDIDANLEAFTFVDQCKGIGKIIKLLDLDLVTDMNFMLF